MELSEKCRAVITDARIGDYFVSMPPFRDVTYLICVRMLPFHTRILIVYMMATMAS